MVLRSGRVGATVLTVETQEPLGVRDGAPYVYDGASEIGGPRSTQLATTKCAAKVNNYVCSKK